MNTIKTHLKKAAKALAIVIHDPQVDRAGKSLAILIVGRLLLALGASVEYVQILEKLAH